MNLHEDDTTDLEPSVAFENVNQVDECARETDLPYCLSYSLGSEQSGADSDEWTDAELDSDKFDNDELEDESSLQGDFSDDSSVWKDCKNIDDA